MYSKSSKFIIPFSFIVIVLTVLLLVFLLINDIGDGSSENNDDSSGIGEALGSILENNEEFEITEVIKHNTKEDCYVIISEEVYNFTGSFEKQPNLIKSSECGTDITAFARDFNKSDLEDYYIGKLKPLTDDEN